jgi:hypothetical protein
VKRAGPSGCSERSSVHPVAMKFCGFVAILERSRPLWIKA